MVCSRNHFFQEISPVVVEQSFIFLFLNLFYSGTKPNLMCVLQLTPHQYAKDHGNEQFPLVFCSQLQKKLQYGDH